MARRPPTRLLCGKLKPARDKRTLKLASILRADLPPAPPVWDGEKPFRILPVPMFGNDVEGCCVIAAQAHQMLRFELTEQKAILPVSKLEASVHKEYRRQTGGEDSGLAMLDSLKVLRKRGVKVDGKTYKIEAFAQLDIEKVLPGSFPSAETIQRLKNALYYLGGLQVGFNLPESAMEQFEAGTEWAVAEGAESKPKYGHAVLVTSRYDEFGPTGITWAAKQRMGWEFLAAYADEIYAVIDARDSHLGRKSPLDVAKMKRFMDAVTA